MGAKSVTIIVAHAIGRPVRESPARRPLGVHAALRPRARRGARPRRRRGRAAHQPLPLRRRSRAAEGYARRRALLPPQPPSAASSSRLRLPFKVAEHVPDMLRLRRARRRRRRPLAVADRAAARRASCCRPRARGCSPPTTSLPPEPRRQPACSPPASPARPHGRGRRPLRARRRAACATRSGSTRPAVHVIPHGAFDYLTRLPDEKPLPPELAGRRGAGDPLLRAAAPLQGDRRPARGVRAASRAPSSGSSAMPRMPIEPLRELAARRRGRGALRAPLRHRRRDPGVLPPRRRGRPALPRDRAVRRPLHRRSPSASRWCSATSAASPRSPRSGAARLVPPGDAEALAAALAELIGDEAARAELAAAAARAAAGPYSWDEAARLHPRPLPRADRGARMTTVEAIIFWLGAALIVYTHVGYPLVLAALDWCGGRVARPARRGKLDSVAGRRASPAARLPDRRRLRRGGGDRRQGRQRARARLPARAARDHRRLRRLHRRHRRARPRGRRRPRARPARAAARSRPRTPRSSAPAARSSPSPTPTALWEPDALRAPGRPLRRPRGRLRLRPGPLPRRRRRQPGGRLLALRDGGPRARVGARRRHRRQRRHLRGPPRRLHRRSTPSGSHDLCFPFELAKRGLALPLRAERRAPRRRWCRRSRASSPASGG